MHRRPDNRKTLGAFVAALATAVTICGYVADISDLVGAVGFLSGRNHSPTPLLINISGTRYSPTDLMATAEAVLTRGANVVGTASPTPTDRPDSGTAGPCGWHRVTQPLPDITSRLQAALAAADLSTVAAEASAYGENCFDMITGDVRYFVAANTDYIFTISTPPLSRREYGDLAAQILTVWRDAAITTDDPMPAEFTLVFTTGRQQIEFHFTEPQVRDALARELTGEAFLDALAVP